MKTKLLKALVLIGLLVINLTLTNQALAHSWGGYHWDRYGNPTIYVYNSAAGNNYYLADGAISEWDTYSILSLPRVGASGWNIHVYDGYWGATGWSGRAQILGLNGSHITGVDSYVNNYYGDNWFKRGVFCQEIGHAFGLDHSQDGGCMGLSYWPNHGNATVQHNNDDIYNMYATNHHYTPPPAVGNELVNGYSGKCMDVPSGQTQNGVGIQQWSCNGTAAQKWQAQDAGGGYWYLRSAVSGRCLDVTGVNYNNGAYLQQYDCVGGYNQQWKFVAIGNGRYALQARHSGRCADVFGSATYDGASVGQYDCHYGPNQQWTWR